MKAIFDYRGGFACSEIYSFNDFHFEEKVLTRRYYFLVDFRAGDIEDRFEDVLRNILEAEREDDNSTL